MFTEVSVSHSGFLKNFTKSFYTVERGLRKPYKEVVSAYLSPVYTQGNALDVNN